MSSNIIVDNRFPQLRRITITVELVDDLVVEEHGREKFVQKLLCFRLDSRAKLTDAAVSAWRTYIPKQVAREFSRIFFPFVALTVACFPRGQQGNF